MLAFDYIVVGGGTAGCVIAKQLAEQLPASKIALIEASKTDKCMKKLLSVSTWSDLLSTENQGAQHAAESSKANSNTSPGKLPNNLTVFLETEVTEFILHNERAVGVETTQGMYLATMEVIACAGSQTAKLLMLSSIGPKQNPSGLCKMGPENDRFSMVGADFKVHGVAGLRTTDASTPSSSAMRANSNLTVMMMAEQCARLVVQTAQAHHAASAQRSDVVVSLS